MGGVAVLARELGYQVSGSDTNVYPPMSTQLEALGINLTAGDDLAQLTPEPEVIVVGNALSRGHPVVEAILDRKLKYVSGPQWLAENVLYQRKVLAVAGTHGKTTTASMAAWILESAGLQPGFLIGGVPGNFETSARIGQGETFVVEADEYDTAFFDKRSKFVHYHPEVVILNNLEYDHADIFANLEEIQRQFHHMIRTVPRSGRLIVNAMDQNLATTLAMGCWTPVDNFYVNTEFDEQIPSSPNAWSAQARNADASRFKLRSPKTPGVEINWSLLGEHNISNAIAAVAGTSHCGVSFSDAGAALPTFSSPKRRLEKLIETGGVSVYSDFAHHPTAIRQTLGALRAHIKHRRLIAVLEPRSNTMRMGVHAATLAGSLVNADLIWIYQPEDLNWDIHSNLRENQKNIRILHSTESIINELSNEIQAGDCIVVMSNGGFNNLPTMLADAVAAR